MSTKAAVYAGSRNLYPDMVTACKSLVANSDVDIVYMLAEDDDIGEELPDIVEVIDVSSIGHLMWDRTPNYRTKFTYMSLMRVCYPSILPDTLDRVLQLDVDTIVTSSIDDLWDTDMGVKWWGAVKEYLGTYRPFGSGYYNAGVILCNLKQMRLEEVEGRLVDVLRDERMEYIDQDAWNKIGMGHVVDLDVRYNECFVTGYTDDPAIVHYAGQRDWQTSNRLPRREYIGKYAAMDWTEVLERHALHF